MMSLNEIIFICFSGLAGVACISASIYYTFLQLASKRWPTTQGIVVSSEVKNVKMTTDDGSRTEYYPRMEYRYQVGGVSYTSDRFKFDDYFTGKVGAKTRIRSYPIGTHVEVHYNPRKPQQSALKTGFHPINILYFFFGLSYSAFAVVVLVY